MLFCFMVYYNSHRCSSLFSFLFLFLLWVDNIKRSILQFEESLFCFIEPDVEDLYYIFHFIHCILQLQILFLQFLPLCWTSYFFNAVFPRSLNCLSVFSWISLSFFKIITSNRFADNLQISISLGSFAKNYCDPLVASYFFAFLYFWWLCVDVYAFEEAITSAMKEIFMSSL